MDKIVKNRHGLRGARRLIFCQIVVTMLIVVSSALISGRTAAVSAILGGLVNIIPTAYFARKIFQYQGARAAKQIISSFYKGEALKIVLAVVLFSLVFIFFKITPIIFFSAYILAQMVFWFAPLIFEFKQNRPKSD